MEEQEKERQEKEYYTTQELAEAPWFPVRSTLTIQKYIEKGFLEAIDISTNPDYKRYRITKQSVEEFLRQRGAKSEE